MRFLIKSAFWLGLALFLIPMPRDERSGGERNVSAIEAVGAAQEAFSDIKGFCERKPGACEVGQAALVTVGERAKVGAKIVYDYLDTQLPADRAAPHPSGAMPGRMPAAPAHAAGEAAAQLAPATAQPQPQPLAVAIPAPHPMKPAQPRAKDREAPRG